MTMIDENRKLILDRTEGNVALHALRFYIRDKNGSVDESVRALEARIENFLTLTEYQVDPVQSLASILGARGGVKGGTSTSEAKKAAAAANGAKGGRPRKPNLYIKFAKSVWTEPDPKLLNELYKLAGTNTWLPDEDDTARSGPYVRMLVPEVSAKLDKLLSNSLNVWEWDEKPFYWVCEEHKNDLCTSLSDKAKDGANCLTCGKPAGWIY